MRTCYDGGYAFSVGFGSAFLENALPLINKLTIYL